MTRSLYDGANCMPGCFRCPSNSLLAFEPITIDSVPGYVMPGSMIVQLVDSRLMTPMPYMWLVAPDAHGQVKDDASYDWPDLWTPWERALLRVVPTIGGGHNLTENSGEAFGERPIGPSKGHPFRWVITGRHLFAEVSAVESKAAAGTQDTGLATLVHRARQLAGSLPNDVTLATWWAEIVASHDNTAGAYNLYNRRARDFAVNDS